MRIRFTHEEVRKVLEDSEEARNNDLVLATILLQQRDLSTDIRILSKITKSNIFESIARTRRDIQSELPYLQATDETVANRRRQEILYREEYGSCNINL